MANVRVVLISVQEICRQLSILDSDQNLRNQLKRNVEETGAVIDALNHLIQTRLISNYNETLRDPSLPTKISGNRG